jgi:hypothetical protein
MQACASERAATVQASIARVATAGAESGAAEMLAVVCARAQAPFSGWATVLVRAWLASDAVPVGVCPTWMVAIWLSSCADDVMAALGGVSLVCVDALAPGLALQLVFVFSRDASCDRGGPDLD